MNKKVKLPYSLDDTTPLINYRLILAIGGAIYLFWWFIAESLLPGSFNPFLGRLLATSCLWCVLVATYFSVHVRKHIEIYFSLAAWAVTLHFYYIFYYNLTDINWIFSCFMTVIIVAAVMQTLRSMVAYIIFVSFLSISIHHLSSDLNHVLFLPGILSILIIGFFGLRSRLKLIGQGVESALQVRRLLDAAFDGICLHDGEFILDANESMVKMFGYNDRYEIIGKSIYALSTVEAARISAVNIANQTNSSYEAKAIRKDGSIFDIEIRAKKYTLKNGMLGRVVAIQDITERKKNEQTKILFEASQEALKIRNEFISLASHELKTPLTSIKLQTQMTQMLAEKNDPQAYSADRMKKLVTQVDRQANRLTNLIEDMLDVSRISLGKLSLEIESTSINSVIEEAIEALTEHIKRSGNDVILKMESDIVACVDRFRIEQVVINLLTNAIKYGEGKPITISLTKNEHQISISVNDQGMGIAKENQERIFDRFERAVTAKNISGLGLGLYISQQIVQAHRGTIQVKSSPHNGACFIVHLPAS